jgi:hypothetical protein
MINEFISQIKRRSLARVNRYLVHLGNVEGVSPVDGKLAQLFCDSVVLPGIEIESAAVRIYGESREMPYGIAYNSIPMNFYVDSDMVVKSMFDKWMRKIFDPVSRTLSYQNTYKTEIRISVLNVEYDTPRYEIVLHDAWPKSVGGIQLDTNSRDIMKLPVVFQYKHWTREDEPVQTGQSLIPTTFGQETGTGFTGVV